MQESKNKIEVPDIVGDGGLQVGDTFYFLEPHVSVDRAIQLDKLSVEVHYSTSLSVISKTMEECSQLFNGMKFMDAIVKFNSLRISIGNMTSKASVGMENDPVMRYCALILNTDKEDRAKYDEVVISNKIKHWKEAGIPYVGFQILALGIIKSLVTTLKENSQNIENQAPQKESETEKRS